MVTGTSNSQNNTTNTAPRTTITPRISIIPARTAYVMPSDKCRPTAGNPQDIVNISVKADNRTRKTDKLFTEICNLFRKDAGQNPLSLLFFNPKKLERFQAQLKEKLSFVQSAQEVPDVIMQETEHGYLVSPQINKAIEAKVTTARAGEILTDPQKRTAYIQDFLNVKGINDPEFIQKLQDSLMRSIMPSGVVTAQTPQEATQDVKNLLEKYKDVGIVFQTNEGAGGKGTAILRSEKIKKILEDPNCDILQTVSNIMHYEKDFGGTLAEEIQNNGLSWQKMADGKELCVMFRSHPEEKQIEMTTASIMFVGDKGNHLGNIIIDKQQLKDIADVSLNDEQIELFTLTNELMLHTMLKLEGYEKGINEIYDAGGSNLKAFSSDIFFSTAPDGSVKHEISEFNARPPSSAHAIVSGESMGVKTPFMRLYTPPRTSMSQDVLNTLQEIGAEKAHKFFKQKFDPILKEFDGAFIDTFLMTDKSEAKNPEEQIAYRWSIFYPHPDIQTKGEKEFEAMQEIHKICQNLTAKEILDSSQLTGQKRKREQDLTTEEMPNSSQLTNKKQKMEQDFTKKRNTQ